MPYQSISIGAERTQERENTADSSDAGEKCTSVSGEFDRMLARARMLGSHYLGSGCRRCHRHVYDLY